MPREPPRAGMIDHQEHGRVAEHGHGRRREMEAHEVHGGELALLGVRVTGLELAYTAAPKSLKSFVTACWMVPIFLANLVFAQRFAKTGSSTVAFGANLLGAMVGGALEYLALISGYRSLLILVALLYGLAFLTGRKYLGVQAPAVGETASVGA